MFDSHCHLQFPQYDNDREGVIKRTLAAGCGIICVGTDLEDSKKAIDLAEKYEGIWATVGLHPNNIDVNFRFSILDFQIIGHPKVVAIGEIGLDYYRTPELERQERQKDAFVEFIKFARNIHKPLIIHCRDAHSDMIEILSKWTRKRGPSIYDSPLYLRGVIHSFSGTWDQAQKYFDLGFYIGLNGIITFTEQYNDVIIKAPLDKILIETDAPYLAPVPHRGKRNEPLWVEFVARRIAELKRIPFEEVINQTIKNAEKLFGIDLTAPDGPPDQPA